MRAQPRAVGASATPATRRLIATADELLVHALAQLSDEVAMELRGSRAADPLLGLLARAYGIDGRLELRPDLEGGNSIGGGSLAELVEGLTEPGDPVADTERDDHALARHRAVVVTNLPTHYRVPLFGAVARRVERAGGSFRVLFLSPVPSARAWMRPDYLEFEHEFLTGIDLGRDRGRRMLPRRLEARLAAFDPTLIVSGGFSPVVSGRAARFARKRAVPFGIWSGELATRETARSRLRTIQRRRLLRRTSFALGYGSRSVDYLHTLAPRLPAVIARNTTVVGAPAARPATDVLELLTVSRAEPGKAIDVVVDAVRSRPDLRCRFTLVGDGPELDALRARAAGDTRFRFLGAIPSDRVLDAYAQADVFLFPSRYDVFGNVLVEAMGAGLATIVSSEPGAVADLCVDGRNALVVRESTPAAWADALDRVVTPGTAARLGAAAADTVTRRWTMEHSADAFFAGLRLGALVAHERSRA